MKKPEKLLQELSDKSLASGQTLQEWHDYLTDLKCELDIKISATHNDLIRENEKFDDAKNKRTKLM